MGFEEASPQIAAEPMLLTAADKLHYLVAIACHNLRFRPAWPWQDFQIALDGHASAFSPSSRSKSATVVPRWNLRDCPFTVMLIAVAMVPF
jgi:hypothetical protein